MNTTKPTREEIAARAYQLWLDNGRCHGQHLEHWLQAETALMAVKTVSPTPRLTQAAAAPVSKPASKPVIETPAARAEPVATSAKRSVTPAAPKAPATRKVRR